MHPLPIERLCAEATRMMNLVPCSQRELFWNFASADMHSPRYGQAYEDLLPTKLTMHLRRGERDALSEQEWGNLEAVVLAARGSVLGPLLRSGTGWYVGNLSLEELQRIRVMKHLPFVAIAPTRELSDFVAALDKGILPPGDSFGENYRRMRPSFELSRMHGYPIVVAEQADGPYTALEGLTRMAILTSQYLGGEIPASRIPMMLGLCDRLREWPFY